MKILQNDKSLGENKKTLGELIDYHLEFLLPNKEKNKQKILEICHTGKFLMLLGNNFTIDQLFEKPDFILSDGNERIGLEHQILIEEDIKEKEGFFENLFIIAGNELNYDSEVPNFLANCYLYSEINYKLNQKASIISQIKTVVKEYVLNDILIENPIIERISIMPHSHKHISPNFGAWWQRKLTAKHITDSIFKKEHKIATYKINGIDKLWLLIVIGSLGESSFEIDENLRINIVTEFDKVFILEDFNNKLYELK